MSHLEGRRDADLHAPGGEHRTTARTANGRDVELHERRLREHLAEHEAACCCNDSDVYDGYAECPAHPPTETTEPAPDEIPPRAADYFAARGVTGHPTIRQVFHPGDETRSSGWFSIMVGIPITSDYLRGFRAEGYTAVQLAAGGHAADFDIKELMSGWIVI